MFTLTIKTDNTAFEDGDLGRELARILRLVAKDVSDFCTDGGFYTDSLHDVNGNLVGTWRYKP